MAFVSSGDPVPCCVDVPSSFEAKARYALRMLLVPLGLEPVWTRRAEAVVVYAAAPHADGEAWLAAAPEAAAFFDRGAPYPADEAEWVDDEGGRVPVLFRDRRGRPDWVASTFLWLSGWQERAADRRDEHGRAAFAYSLNAQFGTARFPIVDVYRTRFANALAKNGVTFRSRRWGDRDWAFCPTHDVDYVRKWRPGILYREFVRNLAFNARHEPWGDRFERAGAVLRQMSKGDPYLRALFEMPVDVAERGGSATYFMKSGAGDPHDVAYRIGSSMLRDWMDRLQAAGFEIGLHPSYRAVDEPDRLREEKLRIERVSGQATLSVRQHYLRYDPGRTPALHGELGFAIDSTLGYAEHEGFRRGTCLPFQVFDLANDRPTDVWEMPLAMMESALFNRRHMDAEEALGATRELAAVCRRFGGVLVGLWHTTLGDEIDAPGWRRHFLESLDEARSGKALIHSLSGALQAWS